MAGRLLGVERAFRTITPGRGVPTEAIKEEPRAGTAETVSSILRRALENIVSGQARNYRLGGSARRPI